MCKSAMAGMAVKWRVCCGRLSWKRLRDGSPWGARCPGLAYRGDSGVLPKALRGHVRVGSVNRWVALC